MRRLLPVGVGLRPPPVKSETLPRCDTCRFRREFTDHELDMMDNLDLTRAKISCANKLSDHSYAQKGWIPERKGEVCCPLYEDERHRALSPVQLHNWRAWKQYRDEISSLFK